MSADHGLIARTSRSPVLAYHVELTTTHDFVVGQSFGQVHFSIPSTGVFASRLTMSKENGVSWRVSFEPGKCDSFRRLLAVRRYRDEFLVCLLDAGGDVVTFDMGKDGQMIAIPPPPTSAPKGRTLFFAIHSSTRPLSSIDATVCKRFGPTEAAFSHWSFSVTVAVFVSDSLNLTRGRHRLGLWSLRAFTLPSTKLVPVSQSAPSTLSCTQSRPSSANLTKAQLVSPRGNAHTSVIVCANCLS